MSVNGSSTVSYTRRILHVTIERFFSFLVDYLSMARLQKGMRDLFIPLFRSDSKHSIGNSSSSSGLVPDFDPMRDFDKMNDKLKSISVNSKGIV